jgi:hypothetical protein
MTEPKQAIARRTWLGGAAAAGAAAAAAVILPSAPEPSAVQAAAARAEPVDETAGYRLSEHVKQYYASARV